MGSEQNIVLKCGRAFELRLHHSKRPASASVVIAGGIGVARRLYEPLATELAGHGFRVATFDYLGIDSRHESGSSTVRPCLTSWASQTGAVIEWVQTAFPNDPLFCVGHSMGCPLICRSGKLESVEKLVFIAGQNAYWAHWPTWRSRMKMWCHWHLTFPVLARVFGRLPEFFWNGTALPEGVARQWARWGRNANYYLCDATESEKDAVRLFDGKILALSFAADPYAPSRAVDAFLESIPAGQISRKEYVTSPGLGHFSFFKKNNSQTWSRDIIRWLDSDQ